MFAIYKVEKTETHAVTNKPTEVYDISEFDRWLDKNVDRTYKVYRNGDGTTRIEDNSGNWMLFNTEYKVNEYTGEKSTTPIDGKLYCGFNGKKKVVLLGAYILNFNLFCNDNVCFRIFAWSATLSTSLS
jgi:hypothetical protein